MSIENDMTQATCRDFVAALSSKAPTPGGGGAAALVAAIGTALGNMVGSLTVGKKKYAEVEDRIRELMEQCEELERELLDQVAADAEAFGPLAAAYRIPKDDPSREEVLEEATKAACQVPMRIAELSAEALEATEGFAEMGSRLAISDAGCAALCLKAALQAASLNVYINTKSLKDRSFAKHMNTRMETLLQKYGEMADRIYLSVRGQLLI